ncbi:hypothetical protein GCM10009127_02630 [Alteraurantiacibacter aestuarii]|uniref:DUF3800 domain-containing protein n=1 Tax=Alteraurantiacibacter aestuarii TaxID=650004 RepID=A0A844ZLM4_9SPHN|nr:DUF3800 domain-containing protein [Alteraurantiacibacter aestuarii]MXO88483.1 hypothetical protein [Alteraurantiacibacter aestuarii]
MAFVIEHDRTATEFDDDTLLVFVDETGDERLSSFEVPYFGFGGCLCRASDYETAIERSWTILESKFSYKGSRLHASELNPKELSDAQKSALGTYFAKGAFGRFAAIAKSSMINETEHSAFHLTAYMAIQQMLEVIKRMGGDFSGIVMLFEHSQRLDSLYNDYFRRYDFRRKDGAKVPCFFATQAKNTGKELLAGLVVADFVAHTAGSMSRTTQGGTVKAKRRDFAAIFSHEFASHMFIDAIRSQ